MIKNIIFDMGNVLNVFSPDMFIERLGVNEEDAKLLKEKVFFCREWVLLDWGYLTDEEAIEKIRPTLPENLRQYVPQLVSHWDEPMVPVDGMEELVKKLSDEGYGIYLLSNACFRQPEYFKKLAVSKYIQGAVISAYEKIIKPMPEIYKLVLDRFNLNASECIFIDDSPTNVSGAYVCGIDGIVFKNAKQLKEELRNKGITI